MGPIQICDLDSAGGRRAAVMARWNRAYGADWPNRAADGYDFSAGASDGAGEYSGADSRRRYRAGAADGGQQWGTAVGTAAPEDYSRTSETVLLDLNDQEAPIVTRILYPTYRGALVVCQGGDRADVRLAVTEAVSVLTGLSSDRITVAKCP